MLSEKPFTNVETISGGLQVSAEGLLRGASRSGLVSVAKAGGGSLPRVEDMPPWVTDGTGGGVASMPIGKEGKGGTVVVARSGEALRSTVAQ